MKRKKSHLITSVTGLLGPVSLLLFLGLLLTWLKSLKLQKEMNTISKSGYDIHDLALNAGFVDPVAKYITAQAAHETANFSSIVFKENNNPFGIKYFDQDEAEGARGGYAYYLTLGQAVQDYKRVYRSYGKLLSLKIEHFVKFLKEHNYFEAPEAEYLKGVQWFYNLYFPEGWEKEKIPGAGGSWK